MATRLIAGGAFVRLVIDGEVVGLATGASFDEDFGVVPANVLNHQGPLDYDSQGYSCRITLQTYIPEPSASGPWPDGGTKALSEFVPTRSEIQSNLGKPGAFGVLQFLSTSSNKVIEQFENVIVASDGAQVAPNSFITQNVQLMAVERVNPA